jgi:hypothetical protein
MAIPYAFVAFVAVGVTTALVAAWWRAPALARSMAPAPLRDARRIRRVSAALLGLLIVLAGILNAVGMPLAPDANPLVFGGSYGGDDPRLLGFRGSPGTFDRMALYAYAPGAELRTGLTLANEGGAPLTVTGLEPTQGPNVRSLALLRAPGSLPTDPLPLYPGEGSERWQSEPFQPFTIPAHTTAGVGLAITLGECPSAHPRPTRAPGASFLPPEDPALGGGFGAVDTIRLDYTVLGIARTVDLRLPMVIAVVTDRPNVHGCPSA